MWQSKESARGRQRLNSETGRDAILDELNLSPDEREQFLRVSRALQPNLDEPRPLAAASLGGLPDYIPGILDSVHVVSIDPTIASGRRRVNWSDGAVTLETVAECQALTGEASGPVPARPGGPGRTAGRPGPCPSTTDPESSHEPEWHVHAVAIDWLQGRLVIQWSPEFHDSALPSLLSAKREAQRTRQSVPLELEAGTVMVARNGTGSGRAAHYEISLALEPGITINLSQRGTADRMLSNGEFIITGKACLMLGAREAWAKVQAIVNELGGVIGDDMVNRIDVAADCPGLDVEVLQEAIQAGRFTSTSRRKPMLAGVAGTDDGGEGFAIGNRSRIFVRAYDKLADLKTDKHNELTRRATVDRRFGGHLPAAATRVEWEVHREWLAEQALRPDGDCCEAECFCERCRNEGEAPRVLAFDRVSDVFDRLPLLMRKLTGFDGENLLPYAPFRLTEHRVDKLNNNQKRAGLMPEWGRIIADVVAWSGEAAGELVRIARETIAPKARCRMVSSQIAAQVVQRGVLVESEVDLYREIGRMLAVAGGMDYVREKMRHHAQRFGVAFAGG